MGSHTRPNNGQYDTWLTPRKFLWALGSFDLDPCAAPDPRPWPSAANHYDFSKGQNGLALPWAGRVWLNPPYSRDIGSWLKMMAMHQNGIALTFARTETEAWQEWVWPWATSLLFISGRLSFCLPDGTETRATAGAPSALIAYSSKDDAILATSGIRGQIVRAVRR